MEKVRMSLPLPSKGRDWAINEWRMKEYGSWEDDGRPREGHVLNVIERIQETNRRTLWVSVDELELLKESLRYQFDWYWDNNREYSNYRDTMLSFRNAVMNALSRV